MSRGSIFKVTGSPKSTAAVDRNEISWTRACGTRDHHLMLHGRGFIRRCNGGPPWCALAEWLRRSGIFSTRLDRVKDLFTASGGRRGSVTVQTINTSSYDASNYMRGGRETKRQGQKQGWR